jgi:hypothetical protein
MPMVVATACVTSISNSCQLGVNGYSNSNFMFCGTTTVGLYEATGGTESTIRHTFNGKTK